MKALLHYLFIKNKTFLGLQDSKVLDSKTMQLKVIKANGKSNLRNPIQKDCISNWPRIFYTNPILRLIINGNLICLVLMRCAFAIKSSLFLVMMERPLDSWIIPAIINILLGVSILLKQIWAGMYCKYLQPTYATIMYDIQLFNL